MTRKVTKASAPRGLSGYPKLLADVKQRINSAQIRTAMAGNASLLMLYWEIGGMLSERQRREGWGAAVLPKLAVDLSNDLRGVKGFSARNLRLMIQFFDEYPHRNAIWQSAVAKLPDLPDEVGHKRGLLIATGGEGVEGSVWQPAVAKLPWAHNVILIQKIKDRKLRLWYARQAFEQGWSRNVLSLQIQSRARARQGKAITNFRQALPPPQSDLALELLKDPYFFDFLTLEKPFHERELEAGLLRHLQHFLVELGTGFAFVGKQVHLEVGDEDFYVDLLFYHLRLRSFVVIDLKVGRFKAEYAGKMNLYLNAVDATMRHGADHPSIGLILCEDKNKIVAEYALRGMDKAIGVSAYQLTRSLPKKLQSALPSIAQLEKELSPKRRIGKSRKPRRRDGSQPV